MRPMKHLPRNLRALSLRYMEYISKSLRAITLDLRLDYRLNRRLVLGVLFVIFCVLSLLHANRSESGEATIAWLTSSSGRELLGAMKSILTSTAVLVGAIWTYYLFVRGRTFNYRADIHIDLWTTIVAEDAVCVIIRLTFDNVGNVRIVPKTMKAKVAKHDGHKFAHLEEKSDLLDDYFRDFQLESLGEFSLEPKTALKTDWLLRLPGTTETKGLPLLYVEVAVRDFRDHVWLEKAVVEFDRSEKGER